MMENFRNNGKRIFAMSTKKWTKTLRLVFFLIVLCFSAKAQTGTGTSGDPVIIDMSVVAASYTPYYTWGPNNINSSGGNFVTLNRPNTYYEISCSGSGISTAKSIIVDVDAQNVTIILTGKATLSSAYSPIAIHSGSATLLLKGDCDFTLTGGTGYAGLHVRYSAELTIDSYPGNRNGKLTANGGAGNTSGSGGASGAGIGGHYSGSTSSPYYSGRCGTVTILDGVIKATGGSVTAQNSGSGAGIGGGGGQGSNGGNIGTEGGGDAVQITIWGGDITANGGSVNVTKGSGSGAGAGIGGGGSGQTNAKGGSNFSGIYIYGGKITATGGNVADGTDNEVGGGGAGIGGGGAVSGANGGQIGTEWFIDWENADVNAYGGKGNPSSMNGANVGGGGQTSPSTPVFTSFTVSPPAITVDKNSACGIQLRASQGSFPPATSVIFSWYTSEHELLHESSDRIFTIPEARLANVGDHSFYCVVQGSNEKGSSTQPVSERTKYVTVTVVDDALKSIQLSINSVEIPKGETPLQHFDPRLESIESNSVMQVTVVNDGHVPFVSCGENDMLKVEIINQKKKDVSGEFIWLLAPDPDEFELSLDKLPKIFNLTTKDTKTTLLKGEYTATIKISSGTTLIRSFDVYFLVDDEYVESIEVLNDPSEMKYYEGELLVLDDLKVRLNFGTFYGVTPDPKYRDVIYGTDDFSRFTFTPNLQDPLEAGDNNPLEITYIGFASRDIEPANTNESLSITPTYTVTVNDGGTGFSVNGAKSISNPNSNTVLEYPRYPAHDETTNNTITINAGTKVDKTFSHWEVISGEIELVDKFSPTTSFIMPAAHVTLTAKYITNVTSVAITGVTAPVAGATPVTTAPTDGTGYTCSEVSWWNGGNSHSESFGQGTAYTAQVILTATTGYTFVTGTTATINGQTADVVDVSDSGQEGNTVTLRYTFPPTLSYGISIEFDEENSDGDFEDNEFFKFESCDYGYTDVPTLTVTVINEGTDDTGELTITLDGDAPELFTLSKKTIDNIEAESDETFTVTPIVDDPDLIPGTYTATVEISGENGITASFTVKFVVKKLTLTPALITITNPVVGYNGDAQEVEYDADEGVGVISNVRYNGSTIVPVDAGTYTIMVDVTDGAYYAEEKDFEIGAFTIEKYTLEDSEIDEINLFVATKLALPYLYSTRLGQHLPKIDRLLNVKYEIISAEGDEILEKILGLSITDLKTSLPKEMDDDLLTYTGKSGLENVGESFMIEVKVESRNYTDFILIINIETIFKTLVKFVLKEELEYTYV